MRYNSGYGVNVVKKEFPEESCILWIRKHRSDAFSLAYFDADKHGGDFRIVGEQYSTASDLIAEWREFTFPAWAKR